MRNIDKEIENFINSIKDLWQETPLEQYEIDKIANRILAELDHCNGHK